jgi:hypothetical protein
MFQVFACKQVFDVAGTNQWLARFDKLKTKSPQCPSCLQVTETAEHVLSCQHAGRVDVLLSTIKLMDHWMKSERTEPTLRECIYHYAMGRGSTTMTEICRDMGYGIKFRKMATSQDEIGWRRFMEGMICKEARQLQEEYRIACGSWTTGIRWTVGLITKLLEVTHGQWLYRNIQVHDKVTGLAATAHKEEIQKQIEAQQSIGYDGFMEEDAFLGECNLNDLETTSGVEEQYWLLAVKAAREAASIEGGQVGAARGQIT